MDREFSTQKTAERALCLNLVVGIVVLKPISQLHFVFSSILFVVAVVTLNAYDGRPLPMDEQLRWCGESEALLSLFVVYLEL
jgi:hypothetical protein